MHEIGIAILEAKAADLEKELASVRSSITALKKPGHHKVTEHNGEVTTTKEPSKEIKQEVGREYRLVQEAVEATHGEFTLIDIEKFIKSKYPNESIPRRVISSKMTKMKTRRNPTIKVVREGSGNLPGTYVRI